MTADLAVCEWAPGSNRSMVDPVVAVARLDMPEPTRAILIEKMKRHHFDDVVSIGWATVVSDTHANSYSATLSNMNFAEGRICRGITRNAWAIDRVEKAIVYIVDGRAYGEAQACSNLFELELQNADRPPADIATIADAQAAPESLSLGADVLAATTPAASAFTIPDELTSAGYTYAPATYGPIPTFYSGSAIPIECPPPPPCNCSVPMVPEPATWALMLCGVAAIVRIARRRA